MKSKLILCLVYLLLNLFNFVHNATAEINIYEKPRELPKSKIINRNGDIFDLSDFKGDFVLAHFWSRDCAPCIKELKSLNNFHNLVKKDGIRLILISPQSEWFDMNEQSNFLKRYGAADLEFYVDKNDNLTADFGIFTTPLTVVINEKNKEIGRLRGSETWDKRKVTKFIKELKKNSN